MFFILHFIFVIFPFLGLCRFPRQCVRPEAFEGGGALPGRGRGRDVVGRIKKKRSDGRESFCRGSPRSRVSTGPGVLLSQVPVL